MTRRQVTVMQSDIVQAASEAQLSPILCRVALIVAEVEGEERALGFVASCSLAPTDPSSPLQGTRPPVAARAEKGPPQAGDE